MSKSRPPNPNNYPYAPPADAKGWTCPTCGKDGLWCGCPVPDLTAASRPPDDTLRASDGDSMASAEYPNKAARQATEPSVSNAPIESPSVAPDDTLTRLDEIEKRWQDQADINTDVQFLLAEVTRLREELAARERIIEVYEKQLASAEDMARKRIRS